MIEEGLDPLRCWFIDIPYSTNVDVRSELRKLGCPESQAARLFNDPLLPYTCSQSMRVADILRGIASRADPRPLLVVDDGAYFARALNKFHGLDPKILDAFKDSSVVEQTTRGHRYLQVHAKELVDEYRLSLVSIARCKTKLNFESPFIGAAVSRAINRSLKPHYDNLADLRNIAVIGFGSVGQATTEEVRRRLPEASIDVVEIDTLKYDPIRALDCNPMMELPETRQYHLVVGCTGYNSFKLDQRALLADGAILASGSSAAVEFNRAGFVELADAFPDDEIEVLNRAETRTLGIHAPITFQQEGKKRFSLLNAGFPVNFDGRMECLPTRTIQATHVLLFEAARQALRAKNPGFEMINAEKDAWIFDQALNEL
jgi:S-adenosylhomocysteine hydrolase